MINKMTNKLYIALGAVVFLALLFAGLYFFPWQKVNQPGNTLTVVGEAKTKERNQIATFSANLEVTYEDKEAALEEINQLVESLTNELKKFGIKDEDIRSSYSYVNQTYKNYQFPEEGYTWQANTEIEITLRDLNRASELKNLLVRSGSRNIRGPDYSLEDTSSVQKSLLDEAIEDAKSRAEIIAGASGRKVGKILSISEGYSDAGQYYYPDYGYGLGGGGKDFSGTVEISSAVTVTFELK